MDMKKLLALQAVRSFVEALGAKTDADCIDACAANAGMIRRRMSPTPSGECARSSARPHINDRRYIRVFRGTSFEPNLYFKSEA